LGRSFPAWAAAPLAIAVAVAAAHGEGGVRRLVAPLVGARAALAFAGLVGAGWLATTVVERVATADQLAGVPGSLAAALAGGAGALVAALALLPRHVGLRPDRVGASFAALRRDRPSEIGDLAGAAHTLWRRASAELDDDEPSRETLEAAVLRLLEVAHRWQTIEASHGADDIAALVARADELARRAAATDDPVARRQYGHAQESLSEQLRYHDGIQRRRERVIALMHSYLAAMEQLRLAAANLESTRMQSLLDGLADLGREVEDWAAT
jgi:hypothetical protein